MLNRIKCLVPDVSWADLIQMSGALAVELSGGPHINMLYGREDALESAVHIRVLDFIFLLTIKMSFVRTDLVSPALCPPIQMQPPPLRCTFATYFIGWDSPIKTL
jgi:hypothetical protein